MLLLAQLPTDVLSAQLKNGLILLGLGMGIVFAFLALLVVVTKVVSYVLKGGRRTPSSSAEVDELRRRVKALEAEVAELRAKNPSQPQGKRGYGATVPRSPVKK